MGSEINAVCRMLQDHKTQFENNNTWLRDAVGGQASKLEKVNAKLDEKLGPEGPFSCIMRVLQDGNSASIANSLLELKSSMDRKVDGDQVKAWFKDHSADMSDAFQSVHRSFRENRTDLDTAVLQRCLRDFKYDPDLTPLVKSISDNKADLEGQLTTFHKALQHLRDNRESDISQMQKWIHEFKHDIDDHIGTLHKAIREIKHDTDFTPLFVAISKIARDEIDLEPLSKAMNERRRVRNPYDSPKALTR